MLRIYKYPVDNFVPGTEFEVLLQEKAKILSFMAQGKGEEKLSFWALIDPQVGKEARRFVIMPTGVDLPELREGEGYCYIGTAKVMGGMLMWHLFEIEKV